MAEPRPQPPIARLPTLTEVVMEGKAQADAPAPASPPAIDEAGVVDAVMAALQPRIDLMLEYRLREALAPLLARAADTIVADARQELAQTLRDVVARAVGQELARRRR